MSTGSNILLSIIIPTKNRIKTCLYAIASAVEIDSDQIEIIVQDCSDTNTLAEKIATQFKGDSRIKYVYNPNKPNMTQNWNDSYERSIGDYVCGIGDDDIILEETLEIARWAKANKIEAVQHNNPYDYWWPDISERFRKGRLFIQKFNGSYNVNKNIEDTVLSKSTQLSMGYMDGTLPMLYHSLISRVLLNKLKEKTNKYLDGTSLDIYSAFTLGLISSSLCTINYPFTIRGACGNSNTNRYSIKKANKHFEEFNLKVQDIKIPFMNNLESTIAESMKTAFTNMKRPDLVENINLEHLFASYILDNPTLYSKIKQSYFRATEGNKNTKKLHKYIYTLWMRKQKTNFMKTIKFFFSVMPGFKSYIYRNSYKAVNAIEVVEIHKEYIKENNIKLNMV